MPNTPPPYTTTTTTTTNTTTTTTTTPTNTTTNPNNTTNTTTTITTTPHLLQGVGRGEALRFALEPLQRVAAKAVRFLQRRRVALLHDGHGHTVKV